MRKLKSLTVMLLSAVILGAVTLGAVSCKAWRTISTTSTYVQQDDSTKTHLRAAGRLHQDDHHDFYQNGRGVPGSQKVNRKRLAIIKNEPITYSLFFPLSA